MKKFRFRLEKVLEYLTTVRDEKKKILLQANAAVTVIEERIEYLEEQLVSHNRSEETTVEALELQSLYVERVQSEIEKAEEELEERKKEAEAALVEYQVAAKNVEVLEKLKEKKKETYDEELEKEEEKFLNELSVMKGITLE